ncbi:hypothetical protein GCM10023201_06460 [Actinomycetospora corticicola]|uniref:Oligosaccharide repeat unit polymerase n=1 Tax=Actinomycetospora corticicola TaxID=663602 RepID=A0A7Y9J460_9PSEU|nr:hypothetical protein [Actinomycetospora corticicola]NYD34705.1 hypothetical protein [Actinomycetospora corticicola]
MSLVLDRPATADVPLPPPGPRRLTGLQFLLPLFSVTVLLAVPAAVFVAPVVARGSVSVGVAAVLFAVSVVYCALRLGSLMWEAEPRWAVLGLWMFSYAWLAVAGLTQTLAGENPLGFTLGDLATEQAALLLAGLICFDVASRVRPRRAGALLPAALDARLRGRVLDPTRVLLLGVVALVTAPVLVALLGGPGVLLSDRQAVFDQLSSSGLYSSASNATGGMVAVIGNVLPFVALICLVKLLADDPEQRRRAEVWALGAALVALNALMNNPLSNPRYWAFAIVLAFFFCWRFSTRPAVLTTFVTLFTLSSLIIFPYLDHFRVSEAQMKQYGIRTPSYSQPVDYVLGKTDYASISDVGVALRVVDHHGHTLGRQLLGAATFWVPRSLWPDKPDNTAFLIADEIGFPNRNLDSPLWAEGYVDFGWLGACGLLALGGLAARRLDDAFVAHRGARTRVVPLVAVAAPVIAGYEFILIRGSLLQAMARIVVLLVLLLLVSRVPRTAARHAAVRSHLTGSPQ